MNPEPPPAEATPETNPAATSSHAPVSAPLQPPSGKESLDKPHELRPPEEIYKIDALPDDLKWMITHFNLAPSDPLIVMLAWHYTHVLGCREVVQNATFELRSCLDARIKTIHDQNEPLERNTDSILSLTDLLSDKPLKITERVEQELKKPIDECKDSCALLAAQLATAVNQTTTILKDTTEQRLRIHLGIGFAVGCVLTSWIFCIFVS